VTPAEVEALARATAANAFIQAAVHFPQALAQLELTAEEALQQAVRLAEEAIAAAPGLADGHAALGRVILCHDDPQAATDALDALRAALALDADHDPAQIGLALALWQSGDPDAALAAVEAVLRRGNALPQPLLLRALLNIEGQRLDAARRDLARAIALAPGAGMLQLEAARAATLAGDAPGAAAHRQQAAALLGDDWQAWEPPAGDGEES